MPPTCSSTRWYKTRPTARLLREPRRALHARIAETLESQFAEIAENQPELLARHCTEAGLIERAASLWGKAGHRSLERSALVEAIGQFTRALAQIATLPPTPALRREEIKLQVALINPLFHVKGYAAPETKAAAERARLLIEQAEALGEPPEDPLLLFSVLYGFWVANFVAFNGDVCRELRGAIPSAGREARGNSPAHDRASPYGHVLAAHGRHRGRRERTLIGASRFTIPPSIVPWRPDLAKTSGGIFVLSVVGACGCLAIPMPRSQTPNMRSRMRARSAKPLRSMYALNITSIDAYPPRKLRERQLHNSMKSSLWRTRKAPSYGRLAE